MKITQFVTRSMPPPHTREKPASIPEHLSQQGSATSLLMSRNLSSFLRLLSPAMLNAQWRCARLIVLAQTHSPAFSSFMLRSNRILSRSLSCLFRAIVFFSFLFLISRGWALPSNACLKSSIVQWCLLFNTSFTFYRPLTHFFMFFLQEKAQCHPVLLPNF